MGPEREGSRLTFATLSIGVTLQVANVLEPNWSSGSGSETTGQKGANGHRGGSGVIPITQTCLHLN